MVQYFGLDATFGALSDPVRRGILEHLARGTATISELAELFDMTLTGVKKHVALLESAGMVVTEKQGRTRHCRLGEYSLDRELAWLHGHRASIEARMDRLEQFLASGADRPATRMAPASTTSTTTSATTSTATSADTSTATSTSGDPDQGAASRTENES